MIPDPQVPGEDDDRGRHEQPLGEGRRGAGTHGRVR
jgi:hypothetical protein